MFPSPSFMESNTSAFLVSVAPSGGPLKSSIVFHSLYSFSDSNSRRCLFGSWMLLLSKALRLRQPLTQKQRYAIFLINNKSILFFHQKDNLASLEDGFTTLCFLLSSLGDSFSAASYSLSSVVDKKYHIVERRALVVDMKFHGVERRFCHHLKIPCQLYKDTLPSIFR